ncbi:cytokine receptor family member B12 isoform X2 [Esox lucius]|uniref:cytokine receptor family member B12 isoform X2 n=1 Tax=Esox lucius TaxID=8010 RepID=UPI0014771EF4|nr:cytokine receptor family member B12 isoform X2 [Esox lucius]
MVMWLQCSICLWILWPSAGCLLPPQNVTIEFLDFKGRVHWMASADHRNNTHYYVEMQQLGEQWQSVNCNAITMTSCLDIPLEDHIKSYDVRVRAENRGQRSNWTHLKQTVSSYANTVLSAPDLRLWVCLSAAVLSAPDLRLWVCLSAAVLSAPDLRLWVCLSAAVLSAPDLRLWVCLSAAVLSAPDLSLWVCLSAAVLSAPDLRLWVCLSAAVLSAPDLRLWVEDQSVFVQLHHPAEEHFDKLYNITLLQSTRQHNNTLQSELWSASERVFPLPPGWNYCVIASACHQSRNPHMTTQKCIYLPRHTLDTSVWLSLLVGVFLLLTVPIAPICCYLKTTEQTPDVLGGAVLSTKCILTQEEVCPSKVWENDENDAESKSCGSAPSSYQGYQLKVSIAFFHDNNQETDTIPTFHHDDSLETLLTVSIPDRRSDSPLTMNILTQDQWLGSETSVFTPLPLSQFPSLSHSPAPSLSSPPSTPLHPTVPLSGYCLAWDKEFRLTDSRSLVDSDVHSPGLEVRCQESNLEGRVQWSGLEVRDQWSGLELRDHGSGLEVRDQGSGLELRDQGSGLEVRDQGSGLEVRDQWSGLELRDQWSGLELRDQWSGLKVRDQGSVLEVRDQGSRLEVRDQGSGLEVRDQGSRLEVRDQGSGLELYSSQARLCSFSGYESRPDPTLINP